MMRILRFVLPVFVCLSLQELVCQSPSVVPMPMVNEQIDPSGAGVTITETGIGPIAGPVVVVLPINLNVGCETWDDQQHIKSISDTTGSIWTEVGKAQTTSIYGDCPNFFDFHVFAATLPNGIPKNWTLIISQDLYVYSGQWGPYPISADPIVFTNCDRVDQISFAASNPPNLVGPTLVTKTAEVVAALPQPVYVQSDVTSYPSGTTPELFSDAFLTNVFAAFVYGNQSTGFVSPPGSFSPQIGVNDTSSVYSFPVAAISIHPSPTPPPSLVDPVPALLSGSTVTADPASLATAGRQVQGVAADGVTEVVVRIPTPQIGDQVIVTLQNDQQTTSSSSDDDGGLGQPGDSSFGGNQLPVTSVATPQGPMAFVIYRAPIDFARSSFIDSDSQAASRKATLQFQNLTENINSNLTIQILRPPLVLIHGRGDTWHAWDNFAPFVNGPANTNTLFSVGRVNYGNVIGGMISSTAPVLPNSGGIKASEIGLVYNAPNVQAQIEGWIDGLKQGVNPLSIPVAAIQADVVAHSMGGLISREIMSQSTYLSNMTFQQGSIHKLITIDTPHLGSPLAMDILGMGSITESGCLQTLLAEAGSYAIARATFVDGHSASGATADLVGDDTAGKLSPAILALNNNSSHPVPYAPISSSYTDFAKLDSSASFFAIRFLCRKDPLAQFFTGSGWQALFHNAANDAVVSLNSQMNGTDNYDDEFIGLVHNPATERLGFAGPSAVDSPLVGNRVLLLLNRSWKNSSYYYTLAP